MITLRTASNPIRPEADPSPRPDRMITLYASIAARPTESRKWRSITTAHAAAYTSFRKLGDRLSPNGSSFQIRPDAAITSGRYFVLDESI